MQIYSLQPETRKAIIEANERIKGPQGFQRFWNRVLTPEERERLGGDMEACYQENPFAVNHLFRLREWSPEHSIIEIAYRLGFLSLVDYEWLQGEIGVSPEATPTPPEDIVPTWNRESGRLELHGQLLRSVRVSVATNVSSVLDRFQEAGWPPFIPNPIESIDPQHIYQVVQSLNDNLSVISFHAQDGNICWSLEGNQTS